MRLPPDAPRLRLAPLMNATDRRPLQHVGAGKGLGATDNARSMTGSDRNARNSTFSGGFAGPRLGDEARNPSRSSALVITHRATRHDAGDRGASYGSSVSSVSS